MDAQVRGSTLAGLQVYLRSLDPELRGKIRTSMGSDVIDVMENASAGSWHAVDLWKRALDAVVEHHPGEPLPELKRTGKLIASDAVNSLVRLAMRMMTPAGFAKKTGMMLAKDFRGFPDGEPQTDLDLSKVNEKELHIVVHDTGMFPYLGATGMGFMQFAFEAMGKSGVEIDDPDCPPNEWAPPKVHWRVKWS